jgi:hypothetical protein
MDSVAPADPSDSSGPVDGDNTLCMNCGFVYVRHGVLWLSMTSAERAALTPEEARDLTDAERARVRARLPDLTRRGGRA